MNIAKYMDSGNADFLSNLAAGLLQHEMHLPNEQRLKDHTGFKNDFCFTAEKENDL